MFLFDVRAPRVLFFHLKLRYTVYCRLLISKINMYALAIETTKEVLSAGYVAQKTSRFYGIGRTYVDEFSYRPGSEDHRKEGGVGCTSI